MVIQGYPIPETKRATEFTTIVPTGKRVRALVGTPYDSTGAKFDICTYFSVNNDVNNVSFLDNATRGDEAELTCPLDSSASISKDEPISVFCTDAECENIAFACDRYLNVPNNGSIIEDNFENEVPRASQVNQDNSFHYDVCQSDDKEIEFSRSDVCRSDDSKNVGLRLAIDSDDAEVFSAYRDDQEFLVDSGQNSETSPSYKEPSEPDVLHSDNSERLGIGPKREAHNLYNTDCSDQGPQYTYTATDVTIAEPHVDVDGVIPQIASMEGTPSPSQDTCNGTPPGLYVHGIIQNTPAFMLVDSRASVTAVSSSLFARISPPVHLDPAPLPYIR